MRVLLYECTICHAIKREGNRWLIGKKIDGYIGLKPWSATAGVNDEADAHFCSDQCALMWQQRQLERLGR